MMTNDVFALYSWLAAESKSNTSLGGPAEQASGSRANSKRRALPPARFRDSFDDDKAVCKQISTHLSFSLLLYTVHENTFVMLWFIDSRFLLHFCIQLK